MYPHDLEIDRPMRVAILGTRGIPARYGGFETFAEQLAIRWARDPRFEITVVCPGSPGSGPSELSGVKLRYVSTPSAGPVMNLVFDVRSLWQCRRDYDLIYMLGFSASWGLVLPRLYGTRVWLNMDGLEWKRSKWGLAARAYLRATQWISIFTASRLIADAAAIGDYYRRTYGSRIRCSFIPYGANLIEDEPGSTALLPAGIQPGEYFLVVARLEPENQVLEMIEGYEEANVPQPLVVVGNLDATAYVRRLRGAAGERVRFVGGVYNPRALAAVRFHARAYLHGHTVGGTNPSLLEALAAGRPIIAHDNPFNREVAGDVACYFRGSGDLATLLRSALAESAGSERSARSRQRVVRQYSWDRVTRAYVALALADRVDAAQLAPAE